MLSAALVRHLIVFLRMGIALELQPRMSYCAHWPARREELRVTAGLLLRVFVMDRWPWHFELLNHGSHSALTLCPPTVSAHCFFVFTTVYAKHRDFDVGSCCRV